MDTRPHSLAPTGASGRVGSVQGPRELVPLPQRTPAHCSSSRPRTQMPHSQPDHQVPTVPRTPWRMAWGELDFLLLPGDLRCVGSWCVLRYAGKHRCLPMALIPPSLSPQIRSHSGEFCAPRTALHKEQVRRGAGQGPGSLAASWPLADTQARGGSSAAPVAQSAKVSSSKALDPAGPSPSSAPSRPLGLGSSLGQEGHAAVTSETPQSGVLC